MKRIYFIPILSALILTSVVVLSTKCSSVKSLEEAEVETEKLFRKGFKKENVHNAFLSVYSPSLSIAWDFSGGEFRSGEKVTSENPFYTASIGKTFTATAIAILVEAEKLQFQDKIITYLPDTIMQNLHVMDGKDYSSEITIAHLLQHTSGLPDYFEGKTIDGSPNVMELIFAEPERFWKPTETVVFTKNKMEPLFAPGTDYSYSDTEYILLGLIVEKVSGMFLHDFFRKHFFETLKMNHTWMFKRSSSIEKTGQLSEFFVGDFEASTMTSLTADWAGGGLVSTGSDLINFQQALFTGKIISDDTFKKMQNWVHETRGMEYGFGLRKITLKKLFPTLSDLTLIGHSGSTGSFLFYCPELDVYLAGTLNQTEEVNNSVVLMVNVLATIKKQIET
jgi:D-alanyl-D-alanine carboxypeptidase